jgi:hypothetical protein
MPLARCGHLAIMSIAWYLALAGTLVAKSADPARLCLDAARAAARSTGVPEDVLVALSVVETGRSGRPWPWTVNLGGDGQWLDTPEDASAVVQTALQDGRTNIDIGCFQLNYRWHSDAFPSIEAMLDPDANALYAAEFLAKKHAQTGDWASAAAAYHSATPEYAERYQGRFEAVWSDTYVPEADTAADTALVTARANRFPLLIAGATGSAGSLVPQSTVAIPLIGAP